MVDAAFYTGVWKGALTDTEEIERLLARAVDVVNSEIYLTGYTVDTVPDHVQTAVYKAVCAQADYIDGLGGVESMSDDSNMSSVSLGRYSYSAGSSSGGSDGGSSATTMCDYARKLLLPTGLLYRGVRAI